MAGSSWLLALELTLVALHAASASPLAASDHLVETTDLRMRLHANAYLEEFSVSHMGGTLHSVLALICFLGATGLVASIGYDIFKGQGNYAEKKQRALGSLLLLWSYVLALCVVVACLSVRRGNGIYILFQRESVDAAFDRTISDGWVHKLNPGPAVFCGALMIVLIGATKIFTSSNRRSALSKLNTADSAEETSAVSIQNQSKEEGRITVQSAASAYPSQNTATKPCRIYELDYMKYILICGLCISSFGQWSDSRIDTLAWTRQPAGSFICAMKIFCHTFFVPGFALISGYFAVHTINEATPKKVRYVLKLGFVYLWCQAWYILYYYCVFYNLSLSAIESKGKAKMLFDINHPPKSDVQNVENFSFKDFFALSMRQPFWGLWYLRSLCIWSMLIPIWLRFKLPLTAALFISVSGTFLYSDSIFFGEMILRYLKNCHLNITQNPGMRLIETLNNFPFFVLGCVIRHEKYDKYLVRVPGVGAKDNYTQKVGGAVVLTMLGFALICPFSTYEWMIFAWSNDFGFNCTADYRFWYSLGRIAYIVMSTAVICSWITFLPSRPSYFTSAAKYSLVAYVLHWPISLTFIALGVWPGIAGTGTFIPDLLPEPTTSNSHPSNWLSVIQVVAALLTANILMMPTLAKYLKFAIAPPMDWMFLREESSCDISAVGIPDASLESVKMNEQRS